MGMFDALFGGGAGSSAAHGALRHGTFNPYNISGSFGGITGTEGYVPTKGEWRRGMRPTAGTFQGKLSPEMEALRSGFLGNAMSELGATGQGVAGFAGITPEMFEEFMAANNMQGQNWMDQAQGYLDEEAALGPYDFEKTYADRLANMRALDAPLEERGRLGSIESQFGKGILASTAGGYQTEGLERALAAKDLMRHEGAFGQALGLGDQYNQIRQMLQGAAKGFGESGQNQVRDRFTRALEMFGTGQQAESLGAQRAQGYLGGVGSIDQFLANLMQLSGNTAAQRSSANQGAWAPYVGAKMASDQFGMDFLGQALSGLTIPFGGGGAGFGLPGKAFGGPVRAGQPYIVGEQGPEIMMPTQPGMVIPNPNTPAPMPSRAPMPFEGGFGGYTKGGMGGFRQTPRMAPMLPQGFLQQGKSGLGKIFSRENRYL